MKSIQELYSEVMGSQELKAQFIEAAKAGKLEEFLKAHGCEATLEEVKGFLETKQNEDAPLSFDELENAAGGGCEVDRESGALLMTSALHTIACAVQGLFN